MATGAAAMMAIRVLLDHDVPEQNINLVSLLMWLIPLLVVLGACIDFALFFLYQTKLHTWKGIFLETPTVQEMLSEKEDSEDNIDLDILFR